MKIFRKKISPRAAVKTAFCFDCGGGVHAALGFCRKVSFKVLALTEDRFGRVFTVKPFRTYAAAALLASFCVGTFAGGSVGAASFLFVLFCYPPLRLLFAIFRRLGWSWFC